MRATMHGFWFSMLLVLPGVPIAGAEANTTLTARLSFVSETSMFVGLNPFTPPQPFHKEPPLAGKPILRKLIKSGSTPSESLAMEWDLTSGRLCIDTDMDRDLTDETTGVVQGQTGERLQWTATTTQTVGVPPRQYVLQLTSYGPEHLNAVVRSGWKGQVELAGRPYDLVFLDNLDGVPSSMDVWLVVARMPNGEPLAPIRVPYDTPFFLEGKWRDLTATYVEGPKGAEIDCTIASTDAELADVKIEGQAIRSTTLNCQYSPPAPTTPVLLQGHRMVLLVQPADTMRIPVGHYLWASSQLEDDTGKMHRFRWDNLKTAVTAETHARLLVGGPFTSEATARSVGTELKLGCLLKDANGRQVNLEAQTSPPQFAIFKDGGRVFAGSFEFG